MAPRIYAICGAGHSLRHFRFHGVRADLLLLDAVQIDHVDLRRVEQPRLADAAGYIQLCAAFSRTAPCHISGKIFAPATARRPQRAAAPCRRGRVRTAPHLHPSRPLAVQQHGIMCQQHRAALPCAQSLCQAFRRIGLQVPESAVFVPIGSHTPVRLPPDTAGDSRTFQQNCFIFAAGDSLPAPPLPRTPAAPPAASPVRDFPCRDR